MRTVVAEDLAMVNGDAALLERIVANLLDNALRRAAGVGPVEITASAGTDSAKLVVVDHGPRVSPGDLERIFIPFQQAGDRGRGGSTLGLSVARGLAEAMGGALNAEASPGGGLTMCVRLPLACGRASRART